jgi:hypothetical protein
VRFNLNTPKAKDLMEPVAVGDVYITKSGRGNCDPRFQVIVGQRENCTVYVGIDKEGNVTTAGVYYTSCYDRRQRVGRVENIDDLCFNIEWIGN